MEQKFLELSKVHDIYAKAGEIAEFISPSKKLSDIKNLRDRIYLDILKKAFKESNLIKDNKK